MIFKNKNGFNAFLGIFLGIMVVLSGVGGYFYFSLTNSPTFEGVLLNVEGDVEIRENGNILSAKDNMKVSENSIIVTNSGSASVALFESILIDLDSNTEISLVELSEEKVIVEQKSGSIWNKFTGMLGMENYEVKTPNAVATVRGTEFGVNVNGENTSVLVSEGLVSFGNFSVGSFEKAVKVGNEIEKKEEMSLDEQKQMFVKMQHTIANLMALRNSEIRKQINLAKRLINMNDITKEQVQESLVWIDGGEYNKEELISQIPIEVQGINKVFDITEKITQQKRLFDEKVTPELREEVIQLTKERLNTANNYDYLFE